MEIYTKWTETAKKSSTNGWPVLPIPARSKAPNLPGWPNFELCPAKEIQFEKFEGGLGIITGRSLPGLGRHLVALDVDVTDPELSDQVYRLIDSALPPGPRLKRTGKAPKFLVPVHTKMSRKKRATALFVAPGKSARIELLSRGQQFLAYGIHPDTGRPYAWEGGQPTDTALSDLPVLNEASWDRLEKDFERLCIEAGMKAEQKSAIAPKRQGSGLIKLSSIAPEMITEALEYIDPREYDTWLKTGMSLQHWGTTDTYGTPEKALQLWNGWSDSVPEFKGEDRTDKWATFGKTSEDARTVNHLLSEAMENGWREEVVAVQKAPDTLLDTLLNRYAYYPEGPGVIDLQRCHKLGYTPTPLAGFKHKYTQNISVPTKDGVKKVPVTTLWLNSSDRCTITAMRYLPNKDPLLMDDDALVANTWRPAPSFAPVSDSLGEQLFIDHMNFILPDPTEADLLMDWLAYKFQNPHKRSWALVMVANQSYGVGRSWVGKLLAKLLPNEVNNVSLDVFNGNAGQFNEFAARSQFIIIEEALEAGGQNWSEGKRAYEIMKDFVDPSVQHSKRINPKYGKVSYETYYFNTLIFTNHADALNLPANDRRFAVLTNATERRDRAYYQPLHDMVDDDDLPKLEAVRRFLLNRDVSQFDPVYPPNSKAKTQMIMSTDTPVDELFTAVLALIRKSAATTDQIDAAIEKAADYLGFTDSFSVNYRATVRGKIRKMPTLTKKGRKVFMRRNGGTRHVKLLGADPELEAQVEDMDVRLTKLPLMIAEVDRRLERGTELLDEFTGTI